MERSGRPSREMVYRRLAEAVTELHERFGGLPSTEDAMDIWHQDTHNSTAIEGNTLALVEVVRLLAAAG